MAVDRDGTFPSQNVVKDSVGSPPETEGGAASDFAQGERFKIDFKGIEYVIECHVAMIAEGWRLGI